MTRMSSDFNGYGVDLVASIQCASKHLLRKFPYPVVLFSVKGSLNFWGKNITDQQLKAAVPNVNLTVVEIEFDFPRNRSWQKHCLYRGTDMWASRKQCGCTCGGNCWKDDYLHMVRGVQINDQYQKTALKCSANQLPLRIASSSPRCGSFSRPIRTSLSSIIVST
jgi:hypothetical protein